MYQYKTYVSLNHGHSVMPHPIDKFCHVHLSSLFAFLVQCIQRNEHSGSSYPRTVRLIGWFIYELVVLLIDWLIDWMVFYAILAIFQPYNSCAQLEEEKHILCKILLAAMSPYYIPNICFQLPIKTLNKTILLHGNFETLF